MILYNYFFNVFTLIQHGISQLIHNGDNELKNIMVKSFYINIACDYIIILFRDTNERQTSSK